MDLNQPTLYDFEVERSANKYKPPKGSDTFYRIGDGEIDLLTNDTFEITLTEGTVLTGFSFTVSNDLYPALFVVSGTTLEVTRDLIVDNGGAVDVYESFILKPGSTLTVKNGGTVFFQLGSSLTISANSSIDASNGSSIQIYGNIYCHHSRVNDLYTNPNIYIDNSATLYVTGLDDLGERAYSLMDYTVGLRSEHLVPYSQGEYDTAEGKLGFNSIEVNQSINYQLLDLFVMRGSSILGDFKYSVLGTPNTPPSSTQLIRSVTVEENSTLYVSDSFKDDRYINPTLYVGPIIDNSIGSGELHVKGDLIIEGKRSSVVLDRTGILRVSPTGTITIRNGGTLEISNTEEPVSYLDGTLIVDSLDQLIGFSHSNVILGEEAKVVILNPEHRKNTVLFSTPNGIHSTYLHSLFHGRLDHVEFHIPSECGIKVDESLDEYREITDWYGGMRLEDAIEKGLIIWNDSFIELDVDIVPWARSLRNLYDIPKLFNTYPADSQQQRLQDLVDYLSKKGINSISFHVTMRGNLIRTLTLNMRYPKINHVSYSSVEDTFTVDSDNPGKLFLKNNLSYLKKEDILTNNSNIYPITKKDKQYNTKIHIDG